MLLRLWQHSINEYEHIYIDNCSIDETVRKIKEIADYDKQLKLIVNVLHYGRIRSTYYGIHRSRGVACVLIASDLQDSPIMIVEFIKKWELGKTVLAVKPESEEFAIIFGERKAY